jgi:hypothetical protein
MEIMQTNVLDHDTRARKVWFADGTVAIHTKRNGEVRRASNAYRVTDPREIAEKLEAKGFSGLTYSTRIMDRVTHKRSPFLGVLCARYPGQETGDEHKDFVRFLLDHRGMESFKVQSGLLRLACANQFMAAPLCVRHTDPAIDAYLDDPSLAANVVRDGARMVQERLEMLRGVEGGTPLLCRVEAIAPRLGAKAFHKANPYRWKDQDNNGATMWAALQGLTAVHSNRLDTLVSKALIDGFEELQAGAIPDCWPTPKAKAPIPYDLRLPTYPIN